MQSEEQKVQNDIERHLKEWQKQGVPIFFEKRQAGGFNYKKGIPDLYVVLNGVHVEFEIKKPNGKPSTMQLLWQKKFKELYNINAYIVESWKEVENILLNF